MLIQLDCRDKLVVAPPVFDSSAWDPSVDKFLPQNYSADNMKGKSVCKVLLQQHLGLLEKASIILVGFTLLEDFPTKVCNQTLRMEISQRLASSL